MGVLLLCTVGRLLFLPCLIPCFIGVITSVVHGMLITTDPEALKEIKASKTGKIMMIKGKKTTQDISKEAKLLYERHEYIRINKKESQSQMI